MYIGRIKGDFVRAGAAEGKEWFRMATASLTNLPRPLAAARKHNVSPSPVRVVRREDTGGAVARSLHLRCSLSTTYGSYQIGGPGPEVEFEMEPTAHESSLNDVDPAVLRSRDACHAAIREMLYALAPTPRALLDPGAGDWYEPALRSAADDIVSQVSAGDDDPDGEQMCRHAFDISLSVQESVMYVKPEALLLACEAAAASMPFQASCVRDKRCAVCSEDLPVPGEGGGAAGDPALTLPSCSHTFHRGCMASWFEKGSTCPLCRHDMIGYLTDMEKQFVIRVSPIICLLGYP